MTRPDRCPRCSHQAAQHWPDDERRQPGCHGQGCLCSYDPQQIYLDGGPHPAVTALRAADDTDEDRVAAVLRWAAYNSDELYPQGDPLNWVHRQADEVEAT